jgi:hypothetical protein
MTMKIKIEIWFDDVLWALKYNLYKWEWDTND